MKLLTDNSPIKSPKNSPNKALIKSKPKDNIDKQNINNQNNPNNKYRFNLLNRNRELMLREIKLAEEKKDIIEKITFWVELQNLLDKNYINKEFVVEILFSSTDDEDGFFTVGNTENYNPSDKLTIKFNEGFEVNYLFERTQLIKLIIYCSDGTKSEVIINLAKVIFRKLDPCHIPIILNENARQNVVEFGKETKEIKDYKDFKELQPIKKEPNQLVVLNFKRTTKIKEHKLTSIYIEFNYPIASMIAKRFRYVLIAEDINYEKHELHNSNEIKGKSPLYFAIATFENRELFTNKEILNYYIEFYDQEVFYGRTTLDRNAMDYVLQANQPVAFSCIAAENIVDEDNLMINKNGNGNKNVGNYLGVNHNKRGSILQNNSPSSKKIETSKTLDSKIKIFIKEIKRKKFIDYILEGMNVSFDVAIDFTSTNLDPTNPDSLHTLKLDHNKYCKAIKSCGGILQNYNTNQLFQVYGFGGVPKNGKEVSHCFNLNNKKDSGIKGLEEVINTYKEKVKPIVFAGPTYLHLIIKNVVENVKKEMKKEKTVSYKVFLILTDGKLDDMNETLEILIEASKLPISIIIVGIGNGDFGKMDVLDGDDIPICSPSTGEKRFRDIVQFVNFSDYENNGSKLAAEVLFEVPNQVEEYCRMNGI